MSLKGFFMGMTSGLMVWYKHRPLTHFYIGSTEAGTGTQLFAFGSVTRSSPPRSGLFKRYQGAFHFSPLSLPGPSLSYDLPQNPKFRIPRDAPCLLPYHSGHTAEP